MRPTAVFAILALAAGVSPVVADDAAALMKRGEAALSAGAAAEAAGLFEKARKADPAVALEASWGLARAAFARGEHKKALEIANTLVQAEKRRDRLAAVLMFKGVVLSKSEVARDLAEAEAVFRSAAELAPTSPAPLYSLGVLQIVGGRLEEGVATLQQCSAVAPDTDLAHRAARIVRKPTLAGKTLAPDFKILTLSGETVTPAALEGRVVLLDFWATWCPPCVASVSEIKALRRKWPEDQFALVSVSADRDEAAWRRFVAGHGMSWPQYRDADHRLTDAFRVSGFPTYVLLDRDGAEIRRLVGLNERQTVGYRLQQELDALLGKPKLP